MVREQIEGRINIRESLREEEKELTPEVNVSYRTTYRAFHKGELGNIRDIKKCLRHKGTNKRGRTHLEKRGKFEIDHTIHERPKECEERKRIGDWELDTVIGKKGEGCIVSAVERKSRYTFLGLSEDKSALSVTRTLIEMLKDENVLTLTPDNGKEFSNHKEFGSKLNAPVYFADPHSPWQRGTNENTNGLIRQYQKKGKSMKDLTDLTLREIQNNLNTRPRATLCYRTPEEVYFSEKLQL